LLLAEPFSFSPLFFILARGLQHLPLLPFPERSPLAIAIHHGPVLPTLVCFTGLPITFERKCVDSAETILSAKLYQAHAHVTTSFNLLIAAAIKTTGLRSTFTLAGSFGVLPWPFVSWQRSL
jgi:hypothetical protein